MCVFPRESRKKRPPQCSASRSAPSTLAQVLGPAHSPPHAYDFYIAHFLRTPRLQARARRMVSPFLGLGTAIFSFSIALVDKLLTLTKQFTQIKFPKTQANCGLLGIFTCFLCSVLAFLAPAPPRSHDGRVTICNLAAPQHPPRQPAALLPYRRTAAGRPHGCTISADSGKP